MTKPIRTDLIMFLPKETLAGLSMLNINIKAPMSIIINATMGTSLAIKKSTKLSKSTKKWQRVQGQQGVPQGTSPSSGQHSGINFPSGQSTLGLQFFARTKLIEKSAQKPMEKTNNQFLFIN